MDYSSEAMKQENRQPAKPVDQTYVIKVTNFNIDGPIDMVTPVQNMGGQRSLFITMLKRLEVCSLSICITQITDGMNNKDWAKLK